MAALGIPLGAGHLWSNAPYTCFFSFFFSFLFSSRVHQVVGLPFSANGLGIHTPTAHDVIMLHINLKASLDAFY